MDDMNQILLEEIRHNRGQIDKLGEANQAEHHEIMKALNGKVGRAELFGWLTICGMAAGLILAL